MNPLLPNRPKLHWVSGSWIFCQTRPGLPNWFAWRISDSRVVFHSLCRARTIQGPTVSDLTNFWSDTTYCQKPVRVGQDNFLVLLVKRSLASSGFPGWLIWGTAWVSTWSSVSGPTQCWSNAAYCQWLSRPGSLSYSTLSVIVVHTWVHTLTN